MSVMPSTSSSGAGSPTPAGTTPGSTLASPEARAFRRSVWQSRIPIAISFDLSQLPPGSDVSLDTYYTTAPRISYLPLLLGEVRKYFVEQVIEPSALSQLTEKEFWFDCDGIPLKWHWPVGLLYDLCSSASAYSSSSTPRASPFSISISDDDFLSTPAGPSTHGIYPWRIKLHIRDPPVEKLSSSANVDACKSNFMSKVKEADFIRNGSTKRVVNLRKQEQDALWEGVVDHDFDKFWSVAARLLPAPSVSSSTAPPSRLSSRAPSMARTADDRSTSSPRLGITNLPNDSQTSVAASLISTTPSDALSAVSHLPISDRTKAGTGNNSRAVPVRFHLSDNAPIVQEPVQPLLEDGRPATLQSCLSSLFPMLFPPPPAFRLGSLTTPNLATPVVHGTSIPLESEIGWLASTYTSADGWLSIVLIMHQQ